MLGIFGNPRNLPPLSEFGLRTYSVDFSLDRLVLGIDNIRHDVYLSPTFVSASRKIIAQLVSRHVGQEAGGTEKQKPLNWAKEVDNYQRLYKELMSDALNQAKGRNEIQIEYLAQTAVLKMLLEEIRSQYDRLVGQMKKQVRLSVTATLDNLDENPKLKGRLQNVMHLREEVQQRVGLEICQLWAEVEAKSVGTMRTSVFGGRRSLFSDLLTNPIVHADQPENEFFMIAEYDIVLGRRIEDPDKYHSLVFFLRRLINYVEYHDPASKGYSIDRRLAVPTLTDEEKPDGERIAYNRLIESWILSIGNMDRLFNWQRSKVDYKALKKEKGDVEALQRLKRMIGYRKRLLHVFYRQFCKSNLMDRIVAAYDMQPEYMEYCPPLTPQQVVHYLIAPKSRRVLRNRLKRMKKAFGRSFSLGPLNKKIKSVEQMTAAKRKAYLLRFLNAFARYHRDKTNHELISDAMQRINIAVEEKEIVLSRENNTLYEFLLPHEKSSEVAPIINHVVIKADVRGSTDITHQMNTRGLNPASYFSLNFFDPISEILSEYDAVKVFIEGDAIILTIFERENTPGDWYAVARACGIAMNMLLIIQRYNAKSLRYSLPILELGIGISYLSSPPTFLFDANNRIMISSAINHADRLSSCSKTARKLFEGKNSPFNLHVFQTLSEEELADTVDDLSTRYNVNGIELSADGFAKLSKEISLKLLQGDVWTKLGKNTNFYTGRFPTKSGHYQRLLIREAQIPVVSPGTLKLRRVSARKFYEVCTNPKLYKLARQMDQ